MHDSNSILVDASVFLAVILEVPEQEHIVELFEGKEIVSVGCLPWEVGNAFSAMLKRKRLSKEDVSNGWSVFESIVWRSLKVNFWDALSLSSKHNIYAYDAYYLEAAIRHSYPLLSLDLKMKEVGISERLTILEI